MIVIALLPENETPKTVKKNNIAQKRNWNKQILRIVSHIKCAVKFLVK